MNVLNRAKKQTGAAAVEFAVMLFLILLLLLGVIEFGFIWLQNNYIGQAAREGARVAARADATETDVVRAVQDHLKGLYPDADVENDCCGPGNFIEIDYNPDDVTPAGETDVLTRNVTVRVQISRFWDPILWGFIDETDLTEITETAVFATEDQTEPGS